MSLPKKTTPDEQEQGSKPTPEPTEAKKSPAPVPPVAPSTASSAASPAAVEEFVVERPVLGYCSPEFLAFMRECCTDDDADNESAEETLLEVIDLTNLSDSEDSDGESPLATPRNGAQQSNGAAAAHPAGTVALAHVSGSGTWFVPSLGAERKRTRPERVICALCEESGTAHMLIRCPTCTKYYHKRCARENGDETICWNCELGSMIDDSELDEEHAKHNNEYLAYLKYLRDKQQSSSPDEEVVKEEQGVVGEEEDKTEETVNGEENNPFAEGSSTSASQRWKAFIGDITADVDDNFHEITTRIDAELRSEQLRAIYSRGFVNKEEFEAQMADVEEFYIREEERLQQLEREKAAQRAQEAAANAVNGEQAAETRPNGTVTEGQVEGQVPPAPATTPFNSTPQVAVPTSVAPTPQVVVTTAQESVPPTTQQTVVPPPVPAPTATTIENSTAPQLSIPNAVNPR